MKSTAFIIQTTEIRGQQKFGYWRYIVDVAFSSFPGKTKE